MSKWENVGWWVGNEKYICLWKYFSSPAPLGVRINHGSNYFYSHNFFEQIQIFHTGNTSSRTSRGDITSKYANDGEETVLHAVKYFIPIIPQHAALILLVIITYFKR